MTSLTREANVESTTATQPETHIHNTIHTGKERRWSWKARTAAVGTVVGGLLVGAALLWPNSSREDATIQRAKVVKVVPETIDIRAAVFADIRARVDINPTNLPAKIIRLIPLFGNKIMNSEQVSAYFTGPNGTGGGEIETLVGAKTQGVTVSANQSTGKEVVNVPASDIVFLSRPIENESRIINDDGTLHDLGAAEWKLTPFKSITKKIELEQGWADSLVSETALNAMQQDCDNMAWPAEQKAITAAYREIAAEDFVVQHAAGVNLRAFNPKDVTVNITGGLPSFPSAYPIPSSVNYKLHQTISGGHCTVAPNALQLNGTAANY